MTVRNITRDAFGLVMLIICSKISINLSVIPLTFQVFGIMLIALFYKFRDSVFIVSTYIIMGLIGIPVFANGGGITYVIYPSFGFILGFYILLIGFYFAKERKKYIRYTIQLISFLFFYLFGFIYLYLILNIYMNLNKSFLDVFLIGVAPFIIKDFVFVIISIFIYERIKKRGIVIDNT